MVSLVKVCHKNTRTTTIGDREWIYPTNLIGASLPQRVFWDTVAFTEGDECCHKMKNIRENFYSIALDAINRQFYSRLFPRVFYGRLRESLFATARIAKVSLIKVCRREYNNNGP